MASKKRKIKPAEAEPAAEEAAPKKRAGKEKVRVVATRMGYDGVRRRREGDRFTVTIRKGEALPSWVVTEAEYKRMQREQEEEAESESDFSGEEDEI